MTEHEEEIDIFKSGLVPKHVILSEDEKASLLKSLNVTLKQFPRIKSADPVIKKLGAKKGDIVKISRSDAGSEYDYYRVVVG